ncbi:MAG TPA: tyrosine-type recombinase/integrase [Oculatellaceae cyanobacterium]
MNDSLTRYTPQNADLTAPIDLNAFVSEWEDSLQQRVEAQEISADTSTGYSRGVMKFLTWLKDQHPTPNVIRTWKAELLNAGIRPASVNAWLAGLRSFFGWLAEMNQIPFDPTQAIKGATRKGTKKRHTRQALTDNEARRLLQQPNRDTAEGTRDYAMLAAMLYTAARSIELHRADISDLRTEGGHLVLMVQGKGHTEKDELLVLMGEAETAMRDWLAIRGSETGALFVSLSNRSRNERLSRRALRDIVKKYFRTAGVHGNKTTHSLRHTAISNAIRHGASAEKVRGMSRHASLDTLMIYYHETDRIDNPAEQYISYE